MTIEILGTEGAFGEESTSYLINNETLIDFSEATVKKLIKTDKIKDIKNVIISHRHSDHCGGLELFIFYKRLIIQDLADINIYMGNDVYQLYRKLACNQDTITGKYLEEFNYIELTNGGNSLLFDNYLINCLPNVHCHGTLLSFSFVIVDNKNDKQVFISGDLDKPHDLISKEMYSNFEFIFHDIGWTGLPLIDLKVHPTEEEVIEAIDSKDHNKIRTIHFSLEKESILQRAITNEVYSI